MEDPNQRTVTIDHDYTDAWKTQIRKQQLLIMITQMYERPRSQNSNCPESENKYCIDHDHTEAVASNNAKVREEIL